MYFRKKIKIIFNQINYLVECREPITFTIRINKSKIRANEELTIIDITLTRKIITVLFPNYVDLLNCILYNYILFRITAILGYF